MNQRHHTKKKKCTKHKISGKQCIKAAKGVEATRGLRQQCTVGGFKKCNHFRNALATFSDPPSKAVVVMNNW